MIYEHNPLNPLTLHAVNTCPFDENSKLIFGGKMKRMCQEAGFKQVRIEYRVYFPSFLARFRIFENRLRWLPAGAQYAIHAIA